MLLVIFGAGASYDSYYSVPPKNDPNDNIDKTRPPLTAALFNREYDYGLSEFWQVRPLAARLRRIPTSTPLEEELTRLFGERDTNDARHRQFAALRFYLRRIIARRTRDFMAFTAGVTNYVELLGRIEDWRLSHSERVALVTFNYDTILDEAFKDTWDHDPSVQPGSELPGYIANNDVQLFKPHGSWNWGRRIEGLSPGSADDQRAIMSNARGLTLADDFEIVAGLADLQIGEPHPLLPVRSLRDARYLVMPAIAVPLAEKLEFECPPAHIHALEKVMGEESKVTHVLVIGWRAGEEHFLNLWKGTRRFHLHIVSPRCETADMVAEKLKSANWKFGKQYEKTRSEGFSKFLEDDTLEEFLARPAIQ